MIVSGEERSGADALMDELDDRPGKSKSIVGRGPAADFVEDDQTVLRGRVENDRRFGHFHHECRPSAGEVVRCPNAGEDAVDDRQSGFVGGNEGTHLSENAYQGGLAKVRRLTTHIRPGDDSKILAGTVEKNVVRNEAL